MPETGGTTTQSGIFYQNSVAALYVGRLCDMRTRPASERVAQVRVEAPDHVDDIVIMFADRHQEWIQAKENFEFSGGVWHKLWVSLELQKRHSKFSSSDRLRIVIGNNIDRYQNLRELCARASGSLDYNEWCQGLNEEMRKILTNIRSQLSSNYQDDESLHALLSHVEAEILTLEQIERDEIPRWMPLCSVEPLTLFRLLRDRCGRHGRYREIFQASSLLAELNIEHNISIEEPEASGAPTYREAIQFSYSRIEVPGTNLTGKVEDLFLWPTLTETHAEALRLISFEDEDPRYRYSERRGTVELRLFPELPFKRAVIVAGAGFGKTSLLTAIAYQLSSSIWLPAMISLTELAESGETLVEFLRNSINRRFNVAVSWNYYCESGRAVLLFDGLDELSSPDKRRMLELIRDFTARYTATPWILTVRDAKALAAPVDATILTIDVFDDEQIRSFIARYTHAGSPIDTKDLYSQLQLYPDLKLLVRIPLFLALLMATTRPSDLIPQKRSDLLERYLYVVFHPNEYKQTASLNYEPDELRGIAEYLAFFALEHGKIGLSEQEAIKILRAFREDINPTRYIRTLNVCGLLQRTANWTSFVYPIIQEYLAACYLISNLPGEIIQRFEHSSRRPWMQMLQFALEKHPDADEIINELLELNDDAFGTIVRLIGQSFINGASVSVSTYNKVGDRLSRLWPTLAYNTRKNVGGLLAHGFTSPLPKTLRNLLENGWGTADGGREIVVASNDPDLTHAVLKKRLSQNLKYQYYLYELQPAVNNIAVDALQLYLERAKSENTDSDEIESLASLIAELPTANLPRTAYMKLIDDDSLPPLIRLAGYLIGPIPILNGALDIVDNIYQKPDNVDDDRIPDRHLVIRAFWRSDNPIERWQAHIHDVSLSESRREEILFTIMDSSLEDAEKRNAIADLRRDELSSNLVHAALLLQFYLGDQSLFSEIDDLLPYMNLDNLMFLAAILGKNRSKDDITAILERIGKLSLSSHDKARIASYLAFSLIYDVIVLGSRQAFSWSRQTFHSAIPDARNLVMTWLAEPENELDDYLALLRAATELGSQESADLLAEKLRQIAKQQAESFQDHDFDTRFSNALATLSRFGEISRFASLETLKYCAEISESNTFLRAIPMIASFASREALEILLSLHNTIEKKQNKSYIEPYIEELAGRLGSRIIWKDNIMIYAEA
jgi:NACHT domain